MNIRIWLLAVMVSFGAFINAQSSITIKVSGVCGMCEDRIEKATKSVIGVELAEWNVETQELVVHFVDGLFQEDELHEAILKAGHDTEKMKASDEVYESLHGCCKYREVDVERHQELDKVSGMVYETGDGQGLVPLIGANISFVGNTIGTATDTEGFFELSRPNQQDLLVVSYLGYENDTIDLKGNSVVSITLKTSLIMDEVEIVHKRKSTEVSFIDPIKVQRIGQKELLKAACCNLSESFETTPNVDVSATDAVSGTRKIEMLGLAGPYVQVTRENMPYIRGLAALYGFSYTPGTWVDGMQLNMGAGSVVNGPESMTGQINVELKKPEISEKLFVNLYGNSGGRMEVNVNQAFRLSDQLSTGYLLHGNYIQTKQDRNTDGFQDMPNNEQFVLMNRWKYAGENGQFAQFGVKGTYINKSSGQVEKKSDLPLPQIWRANVKTKRLEGWVKTGKVFQDKPYASYGLQLNGSYHNQESLFGNRGYNASQTSLYANFIYQTILGDTDHKIKFGSSVQYDGFDEDVVGVNFLRSETLFGVFSEYQFIPNDQWALVLGVRGDYHSIYGFFATPRIHFKYNPNDHTAFRFAAGRGQRTATVFAENSGFLASNRTFVIEMDDLANPYGLDPEVSYNIGFNYTKEWIVNRRSVVLGMDYYYTTFINQVVVDYDVNPQEIHFYNLAGRSYSHSVQSQIDAEIFEGFDVRLAYRYNDPQTDFKEGRDVRPLVSKHRMFINLAYETGQKWMFDLTSNWRSSTRIPSTVKNVESYRFATKSPSYFTFNGQVTKRWKNNVDVYVGGENLLDFRQQRAILQAENPFGEFFDSSLVWGPVQGRMIYLGIRYKIL